MPHLGVGDLGSGVAPTIDRLSREGALAAATVRTLSTRPTAAEAFASISAGDRVLTSSASGQAFAPGTIIEGSTAREVAARRSGFITDGDVVVVGGSLAIRSAGDHVSSVPGMLGDALAGAGLSTGVVTNGDIRDGETYTVRRPAALTLMDSSLGVTVGEVEGENLLVEDPSAPFGIRISHPVFIQEASAAIDEADVIVLDPGETHRSYAYRLQATEEQEVQLHREALSRTDALLAETVETSDENTLLIVVGVTPPTKEWELTPMIAWGAGVVQGHLHSPSTRRADLVTLTDLSPTILSALGVEIPNQMIGSPLRFREGTADIAYLREINDVAVGREHIYYPMALTFIVVQALSYILIVLLLATQQGLRGAAPFLRHLVVTFAAWPLATFVVRAIPGAMELKSGTHLLTWFVAALIAVTANRMRRHPLGGFGTVAGLTVGIMVSDLALGAPLQMSSILGYSPHTAARFTGIGNTAYAILGASTIIWSVVHVELSPRRREAVATVAAVLLVVLIADGAPWLGADVGGILSLLPVFGLTLYSLTGRKLNWKVVGFAALATVFGLGLALGADMMRAEESRTHLARFFTDTIADSETFWTTISRKWATNIRVFQRSIWTWMVPVMALLLVYVLVIARGWKRLLPHGSARRAGVLGALAAGVLGWLLNDSGVVVAALVFVYLAPYLTLLTLGEEGDSKLLRLASE